jgi:hypothetical protein
MASGDTLLILPANAGTPPSSNAATPAVRNQHPVWEFDAASDQSVVFTAIMPRAYAGGGLTVYLHWSADGVTTGNCIWDVSFERIGDGQQDVDSDGFAAVNSVTDAAPGTDGFVTIANVTFTDGADMDSVAVGEQFRIKITRDADNASDTMAAKSQLHAVEIKET